MNKIEELEELALPLVEYLKRKGYPYPTIVITLEKIKLTTDEIGIPLMPKD